MGSAVQSSRTHRQLSESKCVSNLKSLGSDKSDFKSWNDKLINAFAQTLGSPWRRFMRNLNKALDQDKKVLTAAELEQIEGVNDVILDAAAAENIFYVLV